VTIELGAALAFLPPSARACLPSQIPAVASAIYPKRRHNVRIVNNLFNLLQFLFNQNKDRNYSRSGLILSIVVGAICGLSNTVLVAIINTVISRNRSGAGGLLWAFVSIAIALPACQFASAMLMSYLEFQASFDIGVGLCRRILAAPLRQVEQIEPYRLLATIGDITTVAYAALSLPTLAMNLSVIFGSLIYMGWLSGRLLMGLLIIVTLGVIFYQVPLARAQHRFKIARDKTDVWMKHFRAIIEGSKELKLNAKRSEALYAKLLLPTAKEIARLNYSGAFYAATAQGIVQLTTFIPIGLLLFAAPVLAGVQLEIVNGYILVLIYLIGSLTGIIGAVQNISVASVRVDKIKSLGLPTVDTTPSAVYSQLESARSWNQIVLSGVTHAYYNEEKECEFTLGPINLEFNRGEVVFIAGGNGSGKTTLAKLFTGLYVPESGEIRVNGVPVNDKNRDAYRQNFSMVFSDFFLFDSLFGLEHLPNLTGQVIDYLTLLQIDRKVKIDNGAISTRNLSHGQRKRLALLMAYLEDRPIYIFDEWASDQDPLFRDIFYRQLLPDLKSQGKTVIVISHDDRYYDSGDRLIKLEYGRVEYDELTPNSQEAEPHLSSHLNQGSWNRWTKVV
jgi:putative pyoverdin transport system ATP-binding/permease protein